MSGLILYKQDDTAFSAQLYPGIIIQKEGQQAPAGYTKLPESTKEEVEQSIKDIDNYCYRLSPGYDYKTIRDCKKRLSTFFTYETYAAEVQEILASHNIGTGTQIKAAIPDNTERDKTSLEYIRKMRTGRHLFGVRQNRIDHLEALVWSRCKHILIEHPAHPGNFAEMPNYILSLIIIQDLLPGELAFKGNLMSFYAQEGLQGFAGGDTALGLYDAIYETPGTRYAPTHPVTGGGLRSNPLFTGAVPAGFASLNAFWDYCFDLIHYGLNLIE